MNDFALLLTLLPQCPLSSNTLLLKQCIKVQKKGQVLFANTYLHNNIIHTYYLLHVTVIFLNRVRRHRRAPPHVCRGDIKAKSATTSDICRQRRMTPHLRPQLPPLGATTASGRFLRSVGQPL